MRFTLVLLPIGAVIVGFLGCANGGAVNSTFDDGQGGTSASSSSQSSSHASSSHASASSASSSSSTTSSSTTSTGTGGGCDFSAPEDCLGAEELTQIDGDQNHDTRMATGTTSRWFKLYIHEGVSSVISFPDLSYKATLEVPPGMKYDLYSYLGDGSTPDCNGNPLQGVGDPEVVAEKWSDSAGSDDSLWFTFEVRYVSGGLCDSTSQWKLTVEGNTQ